MFRFQGIVVRKTILAALVVMGATPVAWGQSEMLATGLGQRWPNAANLSASPDWYVYVFVFNGIKYIQVNDLNGTVHATVGVIDGEAFVLPIGVDSRNIETSPSTTIPASRTQTIYDDGAMAIMVMQGSDGAQRFFVRRLPHKCPPMGCSGGGGP